MRRPASNWGSGTDRVTQGVGQVLFGKGGLSYIARRGVDFGTSMMLQSIDSIARMATYQPLELLSLLPDIIPEIGLAAWNGLRLGCSPDTVKIKAVTMTPEGGSEDAPDGTAAIQSMFENNPEEGGNFLDLLGQNFLMMQFSGMCAAEAVPGNRGQGVSQIYTINSLTLRFKREGDGTLGLYQRQTANPTGLGIYSSGFGGMYVQLPTNRVFWKRMDGFPDDPYGRAPFGPALNEAIRILAFMNDLMLAFHRVGMPKWDVGFDFEATGKYARDIVGLTDPDEIDQFAQKQFEQAKQFFNDLNPDDAFFHDSTSEVQAIGSGKDMPNLQQLFDILRYRLIIALKQNPVLMGFVNGSTETWSDVQWEIFSKGMQAILEKAVGPLLKAAQMHLQLLGMPYTAVAEYQPIRSIQRLTDALAEAAEIENEVAKVANNWQLNITAAQTITGSAPPSDEERATDVPTKAAEDDTNSTGPIDPKKPNGKTSTPKPSTIDGGKRTPVKKSPADDNDKGQDDDASDGTDDAGASADAWARVALELGLEPTSTLAKSLVRRSEFSAPTRKALLKAVGFTEMKNAA